MSLPTETSLRHAAKRTTWTTYWKEVNELRSSVTQCIESGERGEEEISICQTVSLTNLLRMQTDAHWKQSREKKPWRKIDVKTTTISLLRLLLFCSLLFSSNRTLEQRISNYLSSLAFVYWRWTSMSRASNWREKPPNEMNLHFRPKSMSSDAHLRRLFSFFFFSRSIVGLNSVWRSEVSTSSLTTSMSVENSRKHWLPCYRSESR